jgi:peptidoglycan/LPS O-acetylase OafA/YrhL
MQGEVMSTTLTVAEAPSFTPRSRPRIRLEFVDGIRALMALWVVLGHTAKYLFFPSLRQDRLSLWAQRHAYHLIISAFEAHLAVAIFIVLSGFCLAIPLVHSPALALPGGTATFFKRRAWRILPPYYALIIFSLVVQAAVSHVLHQPLDNSRDHFLGRPYSAYIAHLFLLQNVSPPEWNTISGPLWSIATECQIYILFAIVLLPSVRKYGITPTIAVAAIVGRVLDFAFERVFPDNLIFPAFTTLFLMGVLTAMLAIPTSVHRKKPLPHIPATILSLALVILTAEDQYWTDFIAAAAVCGLLVYFTHFVNRLGELDEPRGHLWLENRPLVWIGAFSYSLYLIHMTLINVIFVLTPATLSATKHTLILLASLPLILACAYGFHLIFERPFMNLKPRLPKPFHERHDIF